MEITFNMTDANGSERWAYDFSTDPTGSGVFGVPQCQSSVTVDGGAIVSEYVSNPDDPPSAPWCFYTNLNVPTPSAGIPVTICYPP